MVMLAFTVFVKRCEIVITKNKFNVNKYLGYKTLLKN